MATLTAVDVGYSSVKALATNDREGSFPSVVGRPIREGGFSLPRATRARMIITLPEGYSWPVGETALTRAKNTTGRRDAGWVLSRQWRVLLCAALSEVHKGTLDSPVVTGLPLDDWDEWADEVRNAIVGRQTFKRNEGRWQTVTVPDALVITQPYGSLLDQAMDDDGRIRNNPFATGVVAIADIGGNTLNLLVADALEQVDRWTQGDGLGLLGALDDIREAIESDLPGWDPETHEVAQWLADGGFSYKSERYDMAPYAEPYLEPLVEMIINRLTEAWPEPGRYDAVLLTGGGSLAIGGMLKARMDNVYPNVTIAPEAQFGNVRGYLKLACDLWG